MSEVITDRLSERLLSDLDATTSGEADYERVKLSSGSGPTLRDLHEKLMAPLDSDSPKESSTEIKRWLPVSFT